MSDTPDMIIRPANVDDATRCGDIAVAAWAPIFESFRHMVGDELFACHWPDWQADKRGQVEGFIQKHTEWALVTEVDGVVVAFITYVLHKDRQTGEVGNNAVDPAYQGHGIGTRQCARALEAFREAGMIAAAVTTGLDDAHAPARAVYEKVGFDRQTPHVKYYMLL